MDIKKYIKKIIYLVRKKNVFPIIHIVNENIQFDGKVALIAGGTGGIGIAIGKSLLENGCKVIFAGSKISANLDLNNEYHDKIAYININYMDIDNLDKKILKAINIFGRIDIFISSVGVHTEKVNFWNIDKDEFDRVMNVNLKGTYFACQSVGRYMFKNNIKGHILIISSSRGSEPAWSPYGISKWSLNGMMQGLAKILFEYGIIVNSISPGATSTSLIGIKNGDSLYSEENQAFRLITPDEVASLAKFLVSDANTMIVGENIHISAGRGIIDIR